jgi:hypothetical protein
MVEKEGRLISLFFFAFGRMEGSCERMKENVGELKKL